jgi:hypothetical protein
MSHPSQQGHHARAERPQPPDESDPPAQQVPGSHPSRRQVIAGAGAGIGLVASGALAGAAGSAVLGSGAGSGAPSDGTASSGDVVAHVRDAATGDIDVFFGDQQVRIRDRAVAARLSAVTR